jgi:hypothetical protein
METLEKERRKRETGKTLRERTLEHKMCFKKLPT